MRETKSTSPLSRYVTTRLQNRFIETTSLPTVFPCFVYPFANPSRSGFQRLSLACSLSPLRPFRSSRICNSNAYCWQLRQHAQPAPPTFSAASWRIPSVDSAWRVRSLLPIRRSDASPAIGSEGNDRCEGPRRARMRCAGTSRMCRRVLPDARHARHRCSQ